MKKLNDEVDNRFEHTRLKKQEEEVTPEQIFSKLENELDCSKKEIAVLRIEKLALKKKLKKDSTFSKVIETDKLINSNMQRNMDLAKEIKDKVVKIKNDEKRILLFQTKGSIPPQIEV